MLGYGPYVDAVASLLRPEQLVLRSAMGAEAERAEQACALAAAGWTVALVSSGDPGTFAMASVTLEVAAEVGVEVEVVPGVTAASAGAAVVGAPLAGPYAALTLSDLLIPWATIEAQLRAAAEAGMAMALFNPRSAGRPDHLARACEVLAGVLGPATPVAVVTDATGPGQDVVTTTLADLDPTVAGMRSIVLVGTADTVAAGRAARDPPPPPAPGGDGVIPPVHPIEAESYRILAERVDLDRWPPLSRAVVARVIHAAADVGLRRHAGRRRGGLRGRRRRPAGGRPGRVRRRDGGGRLEAGGHGVACWPRAGPAPSATGPTIPI